MHTAPLHCTLKSSGRSFHIYSFATPPLPPLEVVFDLETEDGALAWDFAWNINLQEWKWFPRRGLSPTLTADEVNELGEIIRQHFEAAF